MAEEARPALGLSIGATNLAAGDPPGTGREQRYGFPGAARAPAGSLT